MKRRDWLALSGLALVLLILLHRTLLLGEIFSPARMLLGNFAPWTYLPALPGGNPLRGDDTFLFYPMLVSHLSEALHGHLPLWDMTKLAGTPAAWSGVNLGMYGSPFSLILLGISGVAGQTLGWYAFARLFVAGAGMFLFLRAQALRPIAAWAGALVFMLNGLMITALSSPTPTIWAWLPWTLLAIDKLFRREGHRWIAWFGLFMGFQLLGAYVAHSFIYIVVSGAYALWRMAVLAREQGLRPGVSLGGQLLLGGLAGAMVGAVGLFPMLESMQQSTMASRMAGLSSFPWINLLTYAAPNLFGNPAMGNAWGFYGNYVENISYVGILTLFLAGYGLWARGRGFAWFWAGLLIVILLYQYGVPGFLQLGYLPGFRQTVVARWHAGVITAFSILAAWGLDALLASRRSIGRSWAVFVAASASLIALATWKFWPTVEATHAQVCVQDAFWFWIGSVVLATPVMVLMVKGRLSDRLGSGLLVGLLAVDLLAFALPFNPTTPSQAFYPMTPGLQFLKAHRTEGRVAPFDHTLLGELPGLFGLESVTGYDVFDDRVLRRALTAAGNASIRPEQAVTSNDYLEVTDGQGMASVNELCFNLDPRSPILNMLGVRYFVFGPQGPKAPTFAKFPVVYRGPDMVVLENPSARPHAWFASKARQLDSDEAILASLAATASMDPGEVLFRSGQPLLPPSTMGGEGRVELLQRESDRLRFKVDAEGAGYLVLSDRAHRGWSATVDGRPTEILTANTLLRAVALSAGQHEVAFEYRPPLVVGSLVATYLTMLVLLAIALWPRRRSSVA